MKKHLSWKPAVIIFSVALMLSACKDKTNEASSENSQPTAVSGAENTQNADSVSTLIAECDHYLSAMQACKTPEMEPQDAQKLDRALADLRNIMANIEDKEQLRQMCQQGLEHIDDQKKAIGCSV